MSSNGGSFAPLFTAGSQGINPNNDRRHNRPDANKGGGPQIGNRKKVAPKDRGGFGVHGQARHYPGSWKGNNNPSKGNPGANPSIDGEARSGAMRPDQRIKGHGGSPQHRGGAGTGKNFGVSGQKGLPSYKHSAPSAGKGNVSGRMFKRISGHFDQKSKGPKAAGLQGKFGSVPVSLES